MQQWLTFGYSKASDGFLFVYSVKQGQVWQKEAVHPHHIPLQHMNPMNLLWVHAEDHPHHLHLYISLILSPRLICFLCIDIPKEYTSCDH